MALPFWNRKNSFPTQYICKQFLRQSMRISDIYYMVAQGTGELMKLPMAQRRAAKP